MVGVVGNGRHIIHHTGVESPVSVVQLAVGPHINQNTRRISMLCNFIGNLRTNMLQKGCPAETVKIAIKHIFCSSKMSARSEFYIFANIR
jgi:hypothetical protein